MEGIEEFRFSIYKEIAREFNINKIHHSAVHGISYNPLIIGRDLDILLNKCDIDFAKRIITNLFNKYNIKYRIIRKSWAYWLIGFCNLDSNIYDIEIDLFWQINLGGILLTDNNYLNYNNKSEYEFYIDKWNKFSKVVLTKLLSRNIINECKFLNEFEDLENILEMFKYKIIEIFGEEIYDILNDLLIYNKELNNFIALKKLYWKFQIMRLVKKPNEYLKNFIKSTYWYVDRILRNKNIPYFSISGVDGVGKSTHLKIIEEKLQNSIFTKIIFKHWRPNLFRNISEIREYTLSYKKSYQMKNIPPRRKEGKFSFFRIFYYFLDFLLGYFVIDKKKLKSLNLLIYDRHFIDMILDPKRFGISEKYTFLLKILFFVTPKPDLMIYLIDTPEKIIERKNELSIEEINFQISKFNKIKYISKRIIPLYVSDINKTNHLILSQIYEKVISE